MCPRHDLSFCACTAARLAPEWLGSISTRPHLWFGAFKDCIGSSPHLWFCACKTAPLGLELQVSVGPRPHLWFLHAQKRHVDQNNKSLWVPDMTCRFVHAKQRDLQQNDIFIWVPALICICFSCKTATLWPDLQVCMSPRPHLWFERT